MKTLILFFSTFLFIQLTSLAQAPDTIWTKTFGGGFHDDGFSVEQTTDGGYILTGLTNPGSWADVLLIKTDNLGNTIWTSSYGGSETDRGFSVQETTDGGYVIAGHTSSFGAGNSDVWLIKTNSSGDTLWTRTFGGSHIDWGYSVQQTNDEGYIIAGVTSSFGAGFTAVWMIKTDAFGDTLWTKTFGGSGEDIGFSVQQTTDRGYIITGYTTSSGAGYNDVLLIKTDASGDTMWTKTFGGSTNDLGRCVQQTADEGYIITGYTTSFGAGYNDVWLIKTDASGDTLWTKTFGGSSDDMGYSVRQTTDGGYIITGYTYSFSAGANDVWIIRTNTSGDTLWTKILGRTDYDEGHSVRQTRDGCYVIVGGTKSFGAGNYDVWLIKLEADSPSVVNNEIRIVDKYSLGQNYPNPFNPSTKISYSIPQSSNVIIKVFDILGNEIESLENEEKPAGTYEITWYAENLPSGVYFYQLKAADFVETMKMVLMK